MPNAGTMIDLDRARTSGDGMEQDDIGKNEHKPTFSKSQLRRKDSTIQEAVHQKKLPPHPNALPIPGLHTLYRPTETSQSLPAVRPRGELRLLTPRLVDVRVEIPEHKKTKPPRFVPFEPYTGAVNPIFPNKDKSKKILKKDRNNLDIGVLVDHMSTMRTQELHELSNSESEKEHENQLPVSSEVNELKAELVKFKEERDYLQSQLKFQVQVNSELKNLLVASVGEDLQTRVNVLTEDKLQLAKALLDTANNLTTHTEQIEYLASQCEVWRSKFLASSVMVEELARWKADLTQKNEMLTESTKRLVHLTAETRKVQLEMLKNLKFMAKIKYLKLPSSDVISIGSECLNIMQQMVLHSGVGIPDNLYLKSDNQLTEAEQYAMQALDFISQPLISTDEAIKALFGQSHRTYAAASEVAAGVGGLTG